MIESIKIIYDKEMQKNVEHRDDGMPPNIASAHELISIIWDSYISDGRSPKLRRLARECKYYWCFCSEYDIFNEFNRSMIIGTHVEIHIESSFLETIIATIKIFKNDKCLWTNRLRFNINGELTTSSLMPETM